jgi:hypothetical protein
MKRLIKGILFLIFIFGGTHAYHKHVYSQNTPEITYSINWCNKYDGVLNKSLGVCKTDDQVVVFDHANNWNNVIKRAIKYKDANKDILIIIFVKTDRDDKMFERLKNHVKYNYVCVKVTKVKL